MAPAANPLERPDELAPALAPMGAPVMIYCASHSGSRLLARVLGRMGVFMGARLNESQDSLDLFDLIRWLVSAHAPDFSRLLAEGDPEFGARARAAFAAHLNGRGEGQPWGWKLPETAHVLPVMMRLFPGARLIHLVRDGRDVAFSPFVAPKDPFWRKIYFGDDTLTSWRGMAMTQRAYRAHGHLFNAARWVRSVRLGRGHGGAAGERYLEMRYEQLTGDPATEIDRLADFLGLDPAPPLGAGDEPHARSVGKWRSQPPAKLDELRPVLQTTLQAFGYRWEALAARGPGPTPGGDEVSAGPRAEPGGLGGLFRVRGRR